MQQECDLTTGSEAFGVGVSALEGGPYGYGCVSQLTFKIFFCGKAMRTCYLTKMCDKLKRQPVIVSTCIKNHG